MSDKQPPSFINPHDQVVHVYDENRRMKSVHPWRDRNLARYQDTPGVIFVVYGEHYAQFVSAGGSLIPQPKSGPMVASAPPTPAPSPMVAAPAPVVDRDRTPAPPPHPVTEGASMAQKTTHPMVTFAELPSATSLTPALESAVVATARLRGLSMPETDWLRRAAADQLAGRPPLSKLTPRQETMLQDVQAALAEVPGLPSPAAAGEVSPEGEGEAPEAGDDGGVEDLHALTKVQLLAKCAERGLTVDRYRSNKDQLIDAIVSHDSKQER